jgi:hypothetical protein
MAGGHAGFSVLSLLRWGSLHSRQSTPPYDPGRASDSFTTAVIVNCQPELSLAPWIPSLTLALILCRFPRRPM